ncbi:hypothetical protein Tco_0487568 [Tanacetum coccineum]
MRSSTGNFCIALLCRLCSSSWQAYTPVVTDIKSEPLEDHIETEETQPLSPRIAPLSPDYTLDSPDYTPDTPHSDEESEPIKASETRTASPSDSTSPLSPDHPLTRAFYYHSTTRMAILLRDPLSISFTSIISDPSYMEEVSGYFRADIRNFPGSPSFSGSFLRITTEQFSLRVSPTRSSSSGLMNGGGIGTVGPSRTRPLRVVMDFNSPFGKRISDKRTKNEDKNDKIEHGMEEREKDKVNKSQSQSQPRQSQQSKPKP